MCWEEGWVNNWFFSSTTELKKWRKKSIWSKPKQMFSSFLAKKKNETIPLQWLKTKKFYSGLGHLEENEPAKLLHLFTLSSSLQSALARPGVVSPPPNRDNVPVFHGESAPWFGGIYSLFGGNLFPVPWGICSLFQGESVPCLGGICSLF